MPIEPFKQEGLVFKCVYLVFTPNNENDQKVINKKG